MIQSIRNKFALRSSLFKRVFRALFYSLFGTAGAKFLQLICGMLISRMIGRESYGEYSMINSTVSLFVLFAGAGVEATLTRYVSLYRDDVAKIGKIAGTTMVSVAALSGVTGGLIYAFSEQVSMWSCGEIVLSSYFKLTSVTVVFTVIAASFRSFLIGMEKYREVAWMELTATAVYVVTAIILTKLFGLVGAISSLIVLHFERLVAFTYLTRRCCSQKSIKMAVRYDGEIKAILLRFTIPAFIASIFVVPVNWQINSLITKTFGFAELAVWSVAMQWQTIITYIPAQMNQLRPIYTDLFAKQEYERLHKLLFRSSLGGVFLVLPFIFVGMLFKNEILLTYGSDYVSGGRIFSIILCSIIPYAVQMQIGSYLQSVGKMWWGLGLNVIWASVYVGCAYAMIQYGSIGVASAYFLSYFLHCILSLALVFCFMRRFKAKGAQF